MTAGDGVMVARDGPVTRITLALPGRRNALSRELMASLADAFGRVGDPGDTRVVVLAAEGPVFCAGGDIAEYAAAAGSDRDRDNVMALARLLSIITACPVPVIARVQGDAHGGGVGLLCAADIAVAADDARFSLAEARLGLVPAAIAPYVFAALGIRPAMARMLLAAPFDAAEAREIGLLHRHVPADRLDEVVAAVVENLLQAAPGALAAIKRLPGLLHGLEMPDAQAAVAELHAARLASDEGREGLAAFLAKRRPAWDGAPDSSPPGDV